MSISAKAPTAMLLTIVFMVFPLFASVDKEAIDKKLAVIVTYERGMDRQPLIAVEELVRQSQSNPEQRKYVEQRLAALLDKATLEGKSFICKQLWSIGTAESVPAVAKLLKNEATADMACYAIGQNPSAEAGKALRDALGNTPPDVQMRIINLLGDRRDTESVDAIGLLALSSEKQVGKAAVAALGKIGGPGAIKILAQVRIKGDVDLKFAATDAYLRCAEDLALEGQAKQAATIYKELTGKDEDAIFRSAAIKALADLNDPAAVPLVIAALRDGNRMVRTTAAGCVRTMQGKDITKQITAELPARPLAEQVLLIGALADRGDKIALPAMIESAGSKDAGVREAALQAIGKLGNASSVDFLVQFASAASTNEEKAAAIKSLMLLSGDGVDNAITETMQQSKPTIRPQLIEVLSERNVVSAVPSLLSESENQDSKVRLAAFKALGKLAEQKDLQALVRILVNSSDKPSRDAERAIVAVCRKNPDEEARADIVLTALSVEKRIPAKCALMRVLGGIANSKALDTLSKASKQTDPSLRDAAVRSLIQWPNGSAAKILLDIYSDDSQSRIHRLLALRGFARLMALPANGRSETESLELCRLAMSKSSNTDQKKLVLSGLGNVAHPDALEMAVSYLKIEAIRAEAATAAIKIAGAISRTHPDKAEAALKKVLAAIQTQYLRERALEILHQIESTGDKPEPGRE